MMEYGRGGYFPYHEDESKVVDAFRSLYHNINEQLVPQVPQGFASGRALFEWMTAFRDYAKKQKDFATSVADKLYAKNLDVPTPVSHLIEISDECWHFAEDIISSQYTQPIQKHQALGPLTKENEKLRSSVLPLPKGIEWKDIRLEFQDLENVFVISAGRPAKFHFSQIDFRNETTLKPKNAWHLLLDIAWLGGKFDYSSSYAFLFKDGGKNKLEKKDVSDLRIALRSFILIEGDPIRHYKPGKGFETAFTIGLTDNFKKNIESLKVKAVSTENPVSEIEQLFNEQTQDSRSSSFDSDED